MLHAIADHLLFSCVIRSGIPLPISRGSSTGPQLRILSANSGSFLWRAISPDLAGMWYGKQGVPRSSWEVRQRYTVIGPPATHIEAADGPRAEVVCRGVTTS